MLTVETHVDVPILKRLDLIRCGHVTHRHMNVRKALSKSSQNIWQGGSQGGNAKTYPQRILLGFRCHKAAALSVLDGNGGGRGIRTPGTLSGTTVFKTAGINRSPIPPRELCQ